MAWNQDFCVKGNSMCWNSGVKRQNRLRDNLGGTLDTAGPRTHRKFILRCLINREVEEIW